MATRKVQHDDHEHVYRTVKTEIHGLVIDDTNTDSVFESFGGKDDMFEKIMNRMKAYFEFLDSQEELEDDMPKHSKVSSLVAFLESPTFKMLGFPLKDPNSYLLLGFMWASLLSRRQSEFSSGGFGVKISGDSLDDLPEGAKRALLRELKKKLG